MQFGAYMPDQPQTTASHNIEGVHVRASAAGGVFYAPHSALETLTGADALPESPKGVGHAIKADGSYAVFVGTTDKLYTVSGFGALTEIGTGYALPVGDKWSMVRFGSKMLFTNTVDGMLEYDVNAGGAVTAVANAPAAQFIFEWQNCVFALNCDGEERLMRNSDANNHTEWEAGTGLAGYQVMEGGGKLMWGGALNEKGAIVFQKERIHLLDETGTAMVYSRNGVAVRVGCVSPWAGEIANGRAFFVSDSGFWLFSESLNNIGHGKVNRTFIDTLVDGEALEQSEVTVDPQHLRFTVAYKKTTDTTDTVRSGIISYYWEVNEFVPQTIMTSALANIATAGIVIDDVDTAIDDVDTAIDDTVWDGGKARMVAFDQNYKLAFFTGAAMEAQLETPDYPFPQRQMVTSISVDGDLPEQTSGVGVQLGVRDNRSDAITWKAETQVQPSGRVPVRGAGKLFRGRVNIAAGESWSELTALEFPKATSGGMR